MGDKMNNIRILRKKLNISMKEFGNKFGLAESTISNYETGRREPDNETLLKFSNFFGVSVDYLLDNDNGTQIPNKKKKGIKIPVLGKVQAGIPVEAIEDILDYEEITEEMASKGNYFALKVRGNSMEPVFFENDIVIVLQQSTIESGKIGIVLVNGNDATVKRIIKNQDGVMLVSINSTYDPIFYTNKQIEDLPVTILGRVVESRRQH